MKKTILKMLVLTILVFFTASCSTVRYRTGNSYVGFSAEGVKTVQQVKKIDYYKDEIYSTYDDEFEYDEDGNVIKHIQTQYFDKGEKYDEYMVLYQKIGDTVLPQSVAINGIVYMEVEYEILPAEHEGAVGESAPTPEVDQFIKFLFSENHRTWSIDIDNYEVPFQTDRKFVSTEEKYGFYTGLSLDKVLTVGYDNIVLKRFYHSPSKFIAGYNLSLDSDPSEIDEILEDKSSNTTFDYQWDVVAGEIVQTGMVFTKNLSTNLNKEYLIFYVDRQYDDSGRKISEEWKLKDSKKYQEEALTVFSQTLTY